ncbi:hypothetical protein M0222_32375, partial [Myxococcus fulvus]|nr:hypothetical protein [Myxococcus fulvus]
MTIEQQPQRAIERREVQCAAKLHGLGDVVGAQLGLELMEEPEALLCEGGLGRQCGRSGRRERSRVVVLGEEESEPCDSGGGEEGGERKLDAEGEADAGDEAGGGEGVAAEGKEVRVARDVREGEDVSEELGEECLGLSTRRSVGGRDFSGGDVEGGEGRPVDLAAGGEGERGE